MIEAIVDWFYATLFVTLIVFGVVGVVSFFWGVIGPFSLAFLVVPLLTFAFTVGRTDTFRRWRCHR